MTALARFRAGLSAAALLAAVPLASWADQDLPAAPSACSSCDARHASIARLKTARTAEAAPPAAVAKPGTVLPCADVGAADRADCIPASPAATPTASGTP